MNRTFRQWSLRDDVSIQRGYEQGISAAQIAESLGATKGQVTGRAWRLGIKSKYFASGVQGWKTRRKQAA